MWVSLRIPAYLALGHVRPQGIRCWGSAHDTSHVSRCACCPAAGYGVHWNTARHVPLEYLPPGSLVKFPAVVCTAEAAAASLVLLAGMPCYFVLNMPTPRRSNWPWTAVDCRYESESTCSSDRMCISHTGMLFTNLTALVSLNRQYLRRCAAGNANSHMWGCNRIEPVLVCL